MKISLQEKYSYCIQQFEKQMPHPKSELHYETPFQLLVAVILSAQCTDKRVNLITPKLFQKYPDAEAMSKASNEEIFELIKSCSYPNNKAKHLREMAVMLHQDFHGQVPEDRELLQTLPGVGRKTANVIGAVIFHHPVMAVDTHVFRVSARIGLVRNAKTPLETEIQLTKHIPEEKIPDMHHWLILHGRYTCKAIQPNCQQCLIREVCDTFNK